MTSPSPNRRGFLQATAAGFAAASIPESAEAQRLGRQPINAGGIPLRPLGKTGQMVSLLCLGGHASTNPQKLSEKQSLRLIQRAVDEGITFLDNCWDYVRRFAA
ncbi:MAG TPA: twin-arginine translocation signal domain-containing protein [Isosphaeraceae bacterium]|nr:twin-arginine translocation signal domain-containing protein [Isosphaeraceae bacterium]